MLKLNTEKYAGHTPGPWTIGAGSHVCGSWSSMVRVESPEDFHSNGQEYPDGGSTRSYTNVVCGLSGHSETAMAHARLIADAPLLLAALKAALAECEAWRDGGTLNRARLLDGQATDATLAELNGETK